METKNRNTGVWIFLAIVVGIAVVSCCALAAIGAVGVPAILRSAFPEGVRWPLIEVNLPEGEQTERIEKSFEVGSEPSVSIENFAGAVVIGAGEEGTIRVVATKRAEGTSNLDAIVVEMTAEGSRLEIRTSHPSVSNIHNMSVKLEITVPAGTDLTLRTGAGSVEVSGVQGSLRVEAGAGSIEIRDAAGPVSLSAGAGSIDYEGSPAGACQFHAGAGSIVLRLPADASVTVDLSAGLGGVHSELPVSGSVTKRSVRGTIGEGDQASITAGAGVGSIDLLRK